MNNFTEIKDKINKLKQLQDECLSLKLQILELRTGFKEGDIVTNGKEKGILRFCGSEYTWQWYKIKKDGSRSKYPIRAYGVLTLVKE